MATLDDVISVQQQAAATLGLIYQILKNGIVSFQPVPATAASPGSPGMVAYDATHFYVCVQTNTWVRVALSTF